MTEKKLLHETVLAAAMLSVIKNADWMNMPVDFDLDLAYERLQADGGVRIDRDHAVAHARRFMNRVSEVEGCPPPDFDESGENMVAALLGVAYDQVAAGVRP